MREEHRIMLQKLHEVTDYLKIEEAKFKKLGEPVPHQVTEALKIIRGKK